jgi:hypothetical protein
MGLIVKTPDNIEITLSTVSYKKTIKTFSCTNLKRDFKLNIDYLLDENNNYLLAHSDFKVFLFHKSTFATNDIYQIEFDKLRLGWFFPIGALLNNEHDYAQNEHFLPYALNAYKKLLLASDEIPYKKISIEDGLNLEAIYGNSTYVLILFKKYLTSYKLKVKIDFNIEHFLPYLYTLGYTYLTHENFTSLVSYDDSKTSYPEKSKKIILQSISSELTNEINYINSVLQGLLKLESHCLVKFHLQYQIIELLISKVFESEFKKVLPYFNTGANFYDSKERLSNISGEKLRIGQLFNGYSAISTETKDSLKAACLDLLQTVYPGLEIKDSSHALYKVRSIVFHNLRLLPANYHQRLENINEIFLSALLELLITYKN